MIIPGALMIGLVCMLKFSSLLQTQEWRVLDAYSRRCPQQNRTRRVTLVTVDESDYQTTGFPISGDILAQALTNLQTYHPRVIGLDIFRDLPQGQGQEMLKKVLATTPNVIAAEVALSAEHTMNVEAPAGIPPEQVGFADSIIDADGKIRRIVLTATDQAGNTKRSLALLLAEQYLEKENISMDEAIFPVFSPNTGGYVRADVEGTQMLMNFCMLQTPYETISLKEVLQNNVDAKKIRDRIVLIGKTVAQAKDSFITSAVEKTLYSQRISDRTYPTKIIYGVEIHSHATEQIIDSALGMRCALETWPELGEYLWIVLWGAAGISISVRLQSPWKSVCLLIAITFLIALIGYGLLTQSIWIPVFPAVLALCSAGLITAFFDRDMRFELNQRRLTIERTYEAVHNGPLQRLADITRSIRTAPHGTKSQNEQILNQLVQLNNDMRSIFERMQIDTLSRSHSLYLSDRTFLNLRDSLSALLYQVYEHTLSQQLPGFANIQTFVTPVFEIFESRNFSLEEKRGLCLFLQEALLNAGKYATNATRLDVICTVEGAVYRLQIIDDGAGFKHNRENRQGTRQALAIAKKLKGQFQRVSRPEIGTRCELTWTK